jgi:hypothetical protein
MTTSAENPIEYAGLIDKAARRPQEAMRNSTLGHQEALDELWQVWNECRQRNWDGHEAWPVEQDTYTAAYTLISSLPLGADPDGQLTLEWHKSPRRTLSVSVDPNGFLHYAGLFGSSKRYGTLTLYSSAPDELIELVRDL